MVVVPHRLSTVRNADWVYVLQEGRIVEEGGYPYLVLPDGYFAAMVYAQELRESESAGGDGPREVVCRSGRLVHPQARFSRQILTPVPCANPTSWKR